MVNEKITKTGTDQDIEDNKVVAAFSYIWILFLIPMLMKKDSKFCQFHAKQGLILFLFSFVSWFPIIGWLVGLAIIVVSIVGIVKTLAGERWEIPFIYDLSKKINL
jgi:uncharacterized membrane protein